MQMAQRFSQASHLLLQTIAIEEPKFEVIITPHLVKNKVKIFINDEDEEKLELAIKRSKRIFSTMGKFGVFAATVETIVF